MAKDVMDVFSTFSPDKRRRALFMDFIYFYCFLKQCENGLFFPFFPDVPRFLLLPFLSFEKLLSAVFLRVVLLATNSFIFPSFEYVFVFLTFLKNPFAGCRVWRWPFLSSLSPTLEQCTPYFWLSRFWMGNLLLFELAFPYG